MEAKPALPLRGRQEELSRVENRLKEVRSGVGAVVVVEGRFTGTHLGPWRGLSPTGRRVDFPICLIFEFEGESMVAEKLYFDLITPLSQLGVADDPDTVRGKVTAAITHPLVVIGSAIRALWTRLTSKARQ